MTFFTGSNGVAAVAPRGRPRFSTTPPVLPAPGAGKLNKLLWIPRFGFKKVVFPSRMYASTFTRGDRKVVSPPTFAR
jgi:hypothetical protein